MTKSELFELKNSTGGELKNILSPNNDTKTLLFALGKIGRLPDGFDGSIFVPLANHPSDKIRLLAIKNIGKLSDENYLAFLNNKAQKDENTLVRREAVSSLGSCPLKTG